MSQQIAYCPADDVKEILKKKFPKKGTRNRAIDEAIRAFHGDDDQAMKARVRKVFDEILKEEL